MPAPGQAKLSLLPFLAASILTWTFSGPFFFSDALRYAAAATWEECELQLAVVSSQFRSSRALQGLCWFRSSSLLPLELWFDGYSYCDPSRQNLQIAICPRPPPPSLSFKLYSCSHQCSGCSNSGINSIQKALRFLSRRKTHSWVKMQMPFQSSGRAAATPIQNPRTYRCRKIVLWWALTCVSIQSEPCDTAAAKFSPDLQSQACSTYSRCKAPSVLDTDWGWSC